MTLAIDVLMVVTLLLCGGYAGMVLMCQIGLLPGLAALPPEAFAASWRSIDVYMARAMPPYKAALILVTLATAILLLVEHRGALAILYGISLLCSIAGLVMTVRQQLPINREFEMARLPADRIQLLRDRTLAGFRLRCVLAALAFAVLCVGTVWPAA